MKLILKSKQDYKTHIEEYEEEFECTVKEDNNTFEIQFENGTILIEEKRIIRKQKDQLIIIEEGKNNEIDYVTEHGLMVLDIEGLEVEKKDLSSEYLAHAKYMIKIVGIEPYVNELTIKIT